MKRSSRLLRRGLPSLMRPILGLRRTYLPPTYLPLLVVNFAYSALGIIDVSREEKAHSNGI